MIAMPYAPHTTKDMVGHVIDICLGVRERSTASLLDPEPSIAELVDGEWIACGARPSASTS
jgi:hypothetical protein